jgi:hypothetical protein
MLLVRFMRIGQPQQTHRCRVGHSWDFNLGKNNRVRDLGGAGLGWAARDVDTRFRVRMNRENIDAASRLLVGLNMVENENDL